MTWGRVASMGLDRAALVVYSILADTEDPHYVPFHSVPLSSMPPQLDASEISLTSNEDIISRLRLLSKASPQIEWTSCSQDRDKPTFFFDTTKLVMVRASQLVASEQLGIVLVKSCVDGLLFLTIQDFVINEDDTAEAKYKKILDSIRFSRASGIGQHYINSAKEWKQLESSRAADAEPGEDKRTCSAAMAQTIKMAMLNKLHTIGVPLDSPLLLLTTGVDTGDLTEMESWSARNSPPKGLTQSKAFCAPISKVSKTH